MRRNARLALALAWSSALIGGLAVACSSFRDDSPVPPDAETPGVDAGPADALDVPADGAAKDADAGADAARLPFCERDAGFGTPSFCTDLEEGKPVTAALGPASTAGPALIELVDGGFDSARAVRMFSPQTGSFAYTTTETARRGTVSRSISFALRVGAGAGGSAIMTSAVVARFYLNNVANNACHFDLRFSSDATSDKFQAVGASGQGSAFVALKNNPGNGTWFRVQLTLATRTLTGATPVNLVARVEVDGKNGFLEPEVPTNCPTEAMGSSHDLLQLGVQDPFANGSEAAFDDILVTGD